MRSPDPDRTSDEPYTAAAPTGSDDAIARRSMMAIVSMVFGSLYLLPFLVGAGVMAWVFVTTPPEGLAARLQDIPRALSENVWVIRLAWLCSCTSLLVGVITGLIAAIRDSGKRLRFAGLLFNVALFVLPIALSLVLVFGKARLFSPTPTP